MNWIDPLIFSAPSRIGQLFIDNLLNGSLWYHMRITIFDTLAGFLIGTLVGILLASLLWYSERFSKISDPFLVVFNALLQVALCLFIFFYFVCVCSLYHSTMLYIN